MIKAIQKIEPSIGEILWISPLEENQFEEYKLNSSKMIPKLGIRKEDMRFWPKNQPQWDGIGIAKKADIAENTIILVEAKAHIRETYSACTATDEDSKKLIENSLKETHGKLSVCHSYDQEIWMTTYYQLGNRLTFLHKLKERGYRVKLVLLNIVNDPTHIPTSEKDWKVHYNNVLFTMLGSTEVPEDVIILNMEIQQKIF